MKPLWITFLAALLGQAVQGTPPSPAAQMERGADVVTDSTLFTARVVTSLISTIKEKGTLLTYISQAGRPRLVDVIAKHGKPDKVVEEEWSTGFAPGKGAFNEAFVVHYYGRFALGVRKGDAEGGIEYIAAKPLRD